MAIAELSNKTKSGIVDRGTHKVNFYTVGKFHMPKTIEELSTEEVLPTLPAGKQMGVN